jgi:hypothetical protein
MPATNVTTDIETIDAPASSAQRARFVMPVASREEIRSGILYMVGAVFVFSAVNALVKWEAARYPLDEVVFFRCLFSLIPCTPIASASMSGARCSSSSR